MVKRICSVDGCDKPHQARGMCSTHYSRDYQQAETECAVCGVTVKRRTQIARAACSSQCRAILQYGYPWSGKELVGPVQPRPSVPKPELPVRVRFVVGYCRYCLASFVHDNRTTRGIIRYCSARCTRRWHKEQRKAKRFDRVSIAVRRLVYLRDDGVCQLCSLAVDLTLPFWHPQGATLDHIECQSFALIPDHSPDNLRLAHRQCNSQRGTRAA